MHCSNYVKPEFCLRCAIEESRNGQLRILFLPHCNKLVLSYSIRSHVMHIIDARFIFYSSSKKRVLATYARTRVRRLFRKEDEPGILRIGIIQFYGNDYI